MTLCLSCTPRKLLAIIIYCSPPGHELIWQKINMTQSSKIHCTTIIKLLHYWWRITFSNLQVTTGCVLYPCQKHDTVTNNNSRCASVCKPWVFIGSSNKITVLMQQVNPQGNSSSEQKPQNYAMHGWLEGMIMQ